MPPLMTALIVLQIFVVLFLALHDWIPLGSLNDVKAVQAADSRMRLVIVTILSTLPFAVALWGTIVNANALMPAWLFWLLWIGYVTLLYGALRAWWIPYLFVPNPARAARYQSMFGRTASFLPEHNGIRPNTLHVILHIVIVAIVVVLADMTFGH
jgi:hypothetical protein